MSPTMDPVARICDQLGVDRQEALYYCEGFQWDLNSAMEACRTKTLPPVRVKSSPRVSVNEKSDVGPSNPPRVVSSSHGNTPNQQPSQSKEELIDAFCGVAIGTNPEEAEYFLNRCNWNVDLAIGIFMDERRPTPGKSNSQRYSEVNRSHLQRSGKNILEGSSKDACSMMDWTSMYAVVDQQSLLYNVPVVSKDGKIGSSSSSSSMDVDQTETEKSLKEAGEEHIPEAAPLVASSQESTSLWPPMDTWVDRICDENKVCRDEAIYYLEGFGWNFDVAMEACRNKTLPPDKETYLHVVPVTEESNEPLWELNNERLINAFHEAAPGVSRKKAIKYLNVCNWDVDQAVNSFFDGISPGEIPAALTLSMRENKDQGYLKDGERGSSSSSIKGKGVMEDSSMDHFATKDRTIVGPRNVPTTITISIGLADDTSGKSIDIPFSSNQTVRDIRNVIDQLTADKNRGYFLQSTSGVEYRDMNTTLYRIYIEESTSLLQVFLDP